MCECRSAGIISIGSAVPEKVLTNADLEKIVDTTDEWIRTMTGISERRVSEDNESTSDFAVKAAKIALERANLKPTDLDLIIVSTVTSDMPFPATASIVQNAIGATGVPAFDLAAGCSGWVYALSVANSFVLSGMYNRILVIGADMLTKVTNWTDRTTCILFGDGAGAAIVAPVDQDSGFLGFELGSDGSGADALRIPVGGSRKPCTAADIEAHLDKIHMEGREVFKFAVRVQGEAIERLLDRYDIAINDIDMVVPHQANIRIIESAAKRFGLPIEKFYVNLHKYGNTSGASIPLALEEAVTMGKIKKGDTVVTVGFGAGLTWAAGVMKWAF